MSRGTVVLLLALAAIFEAAGDAFIRSGLRRTGFPTVALMAAGTLALFLYGYFVNVAPWDFGRLLGIYMTLFFVMAQVFSWLIFHQPPEKPVLVGGALIMAGGAIMVVWK